MTLAFFQMVGTVACWIEALKIDATGEASTWAYDFKTQFGIPSGPGDLEVDIMDSLW